ncbi:hypothetical protein A3J19_04145 [Candidatus Daviesbacteria bacterium RIFCSPLOWO2_02_FULL_41_8]|uniref:Uncharacterized protein n=3 Tax=Candidatus Daviesiibacteriota TaxID=1752718 RepID=A0A1F5NI80_9BACT|nr:MAG: hypothetical protein A2871_00820 [Candidatus Daviesbacteria bacterium RIFCSPHIGHO2_01_FULL_41_23]OGE33448.1 MAG: hypothetical protein A3D83_00430 [Candidatus Daviesbacteria bacterium RIFCSPHIGHO2_02_FULL_41_10]OGE62437.1 MAG: hypothetical protein A2967_01305 [Candidatus Daviesbacteria bacterium RIFCSPLOWO2_01_FULL_41_32]OGE77328.1 MAG: hypothetical protein A3J19_04145 [Candidatus Daviesbacteria bacterium RIFCSPLOWO2_02_FULL_41_8]
MAIALNRESTDLAELAKAREAFAKTHGKSIQIGSVHYYKKSFRGTEQNIQELQALTQTPEFQKQYPDHHVYALGGEIIGSRPRQFLDIKSYRMAVMKLNQTVAERGITLFDCAIISTGPERTESLPTY